MWKFNTYKPLISKMEKTFTLKLGSDVLDTFGIRSNRIYFIFYLFWISLIPPEIIGFKILMEFK